MKKSIFLALQVILFTQMTGIAQVTIIVNKRNASYFGITPIKLSVVPPPAFVFLPAPAIFTKNGEDPLTSLYQFNGTKMMLDYRTIKDSLTKNILAENIEAFKINDYDGVLINQQFINGPTSINTLVLAFGNSNYTYLLNGFYPTADATYGALIRKALLTAYVDTFGYASPPPAKIARQSQKLQHSGQPQLTTSFHINTAGTGFKVAETIGQAIVYYTKDGAYPSYGKDKSFIKLAGVKAIVSEDHWAEYAKNILNGYSEFKEPDSTNGIILSSPTDGLSGYELVCNAKVGDGAATVDVTVYQRLLFDADTIYILAGISYPGAETTSSEIFKTIFNTFTRK